jgi:uncharacterized protein
MIRAVLDTNVVLSAKKSANPQSPNKSILDLWEQGHFIFLFTEDTLGEYVEKLVSHNIDHATILLFARRIRFLAEAVEVRYFHLRSYPSDPDDTAFLLCALNGQATHLVTYDHHLTDLEVLYEMFKICAPVDFLKDLRAELR